MQASECSNENMGRGTDVHTVCKLRQQCCCLILMTIVSTISPFSSLAHIFLSVQDLTGKLTPISFCNDNESLLNKAHKINNSYTLKRAKYTKIVNHPLPKKGERLLKDESAKKKYCANPKLSSDLRKRLLTDINK